MKKVTISAITVALTAAPGMAETVTEVGAFEFLVGAHNCEGVVSPADGTAQTTFQSHWDGEYMADGAIIADHFKVVIGPEQVIHYGTTFRTHGPEAGWTSQYIFVPTGKWMEVGTQSLGGVRREDGALRFKGYDEGGHLLDITLTPNETGHHWEGVTLEGPNAAQIGQVATISCQDVDPR